MSEALLEERESNPYNMKKPWHDADQGTRSRADEMFYEEEPQQKATRKKQAAPKEEAEEVPQQETNYKKRYDDLKKHYDSKLNEFRQREQELIAASQPEYQTPKSEEDLTRFREEYPDLYDTVETVAHMRAEEQMKEMRQRFSAIEQREMEIARREAETALKDRHPDFDEIRGDDSFHDWAKEQPEQIQDWIYNNPDNVTLAVKALDLYKLETGRGRKGPGRPRKQQPASAGSAADMVSTKTTGVDAKQPKIWTESEIAKMSLDQFDKHEEEIREAISEGRVRRG